MPMGANDLDVDTLRHNLGESESTQTAQVSLRRLARVYGNEIRIHTKVIYEEFEV